MKQIIINTPKGQYTLPISLVAEDRANYYACEVDGHEKGSKEWQDEVDWVCNDGFEAIDWLLNNTDWYDWKDKASKLNDNVLVTDDDFWTSSDDFTIV